MKGVEEVAGPRGSNSSDSQEVRALGAEPPALQSPVVAGCGVYFFLFLFLLAAVFRLADGFRDLECRRYYDRTHADVVVLGQAAYEFAIANGHLPTSLEDITSFMSVPAGWRPKDKWGRRYVFVTSTDCAGAKSCSLDCGLSGSFCIGTLGADGEPWGGDEAEDRWLCAELDAQLHEPWLHSWSF